MCDTRSRYQIHVADKTRPPGRMPTSSRAVAITKCALPPGRMPTSSRAVAVTKVRIRKVRPQWVLEGAGLC